jgi:hypothetical protein
MVLGPPTTREEALGPHMARLRALEKVVHQENVLERETQKWVAELPGQKTEMPNQDQETV